MKGADNAHTESATREPPAAPRTGVESQVAASPQPGPNPEVPVPTLDEFKSMCAGLPEDCMAGGLGLHASGKYCNRYTCRSCAPTRFRVAVQSAFATAAHQGLRCRLTVLPDPALIASEHGFELKKVHKQLMTDTRQVHGNQASFICSFGRGVDGRMTLEEFVSVDFSKSLGPLKSMRGSLKALGRTCRKLEKEGLVSIREVAPEKVRAEVLSMVKEVIALLSEGGKPIWVISSSLDIGISVGKKKPNVAAGATGSASAAQPQQALCI